MKKTIITLVLLTTFASNAAFVSFISDSKYNIASNDPSSETGQIVGGGEYVSSEPSNGGGNEPVVVACEGPELTKRDLQNLIMSGGDYSKACISGITDFSDLFRGDVNYDITGWDVSHVTNFASMFSGSSFNQDISGWDVSSGTDFSFMFSDTANFNQDISGWNMSNAQTLMNMFAGARKFNQNISNWNVSNVTHFGNMFQGTLAFNQDISGWDVSKSQNFSGMFQYSSVFDQDISGWNVSSGIYFNNMFKAANSFNQDISGWDVSASSSWYDFNFASSLASENIPAKFR
ncbi:BspA family leucine-rich repeat surface protein [Vibrio parahaemolyticus]|nr:BspA family leucine-rich repeat surface protein [Vibrio parahaemolyticus]